VSLLTELDAFFTEHQRCGDLDAGVEGEMVWIACKCGASMVRRADEPDDVGPVSETTAAPLAEIAVAVGGFTKHACAVTR
jgi:hypothetical protein